MSHFRGELQGDNWTPAVRSSNRMLVGHIHSWTMGVEVIAQKFDTPGDRFEIYRTGGSQGAGPRILLGTLHADGTFEAEKNAKGARR